MNNEYLKFLQYLLSLLSLKKSNFIIRILEEQINSKRFYICQYPQKAGSIGKLK
jgi:hypothetical protein